MQTLEQNIWDLLNPGVEDLGLRLVRVRLSGGNNPTLQIMIEPKGASLENMLSVDVEQCAEVSRMASALLDVEDIIDSKYHLEVSSTGLERPLVTLEDFVLYKGARAYIKMNVPTDGRFKFKGFIDGVEGEEILFTTSDTNESVKLNYEYMHSAKRIFTDEELDEMFKALESKEQTEIETEDE